MIYLIRHAESVGNAGEVINDINHNPLSKKGEQQAIEFAEKMNIKPDLIVMSPYIRTQQTAAPLIAKFPDVLTEIWPVQEYTFLAADKCLNTTQTERGIISQEYIKRNDADYVDGEGAESFNQMLVRVDDMLARLSKIERNKIVFVFTHGRFMRVVDMRLNNMKMDIKTLSTMPSIDNTEILEISLDKSV